MEVFFKNKRTQKKCENPQKEFRWNNDLIEWVSYRMVQLREFQTLLDVKNLKDANFHSLHWNRKYEIAIDVLLWNRRLSRRIILKPMNWDNIFEDMCNDEKIKTVTAIEIQEINEKHYN